MVSYPLIRFLSTIFLVIFLTQHSGIFGLEGDEEEDFIDVMDKLDRVEEGQDPDKIKEEIVAKRNESMKTDGRWNAKEMQCSKAHKVFERAATVQIYMGAKDKPAEKGHYEDNMTCHQLFMGDKGCTVEVECQVVDLRVDPLTKACGDEENLRLSDGLEGEWTGCEGKNVLYRPRGKLRDMYLQVKTREDKIFSRDYEGYKCTARCIKGESKAQELPKSREVKVLSNCVCGIAGHDKDRIVGGKDAKFNEFPCGALINDKYVLTAAHCFDLAGVVAGQIDVLLHAHLLDAKQAKDKKDDAKFGEKGWVKAAGHDLEKLTDEDEETLRYEVDEIINHPLFGTKYDYDVALLRLNKRVDFANTPQVASICMPDAGIYDNNPFYEAGKIATVVGWGLGHELAGGSTRLLQKLDVPIIDFAVCKSFIKKTPLTDRMYCAGFLEGEKDACKGDSGGPMLQKQDNGQSYQIGIVSWGEGCARKNSPGVYSRMTELVQWIYYHTQDGKYCEKKQEGKKEK